jgi:nitroimidazol reductase NimA-like FMN-containing flavoprotein (pyridoxamine 5'-phosphate oxidase superfamily)
VPVEWPDSVDEILGGDLTAALAYVTPASGAVVVAVTPLGLRDRRRGTVTFTTSLGFGRKLERIRREPHVALAYHAREHGRAIGQQYVLVQGRAEPIMEPAQEARSVIRERSSEFLGPARRGPVWDRLLHEYYEVRVPIEVVVDRVAVWPDLRAAGEPELRGDPPPPVTLESQSPPKHGSGPRLDPVRAAKRLSRTAHVLLGFVGADGYPAIVPVAVAVAGEAGIELSAAPGLVPPGSRRAGLLGHSYKPQLVGLEAHQHTGWLECDGRRTLYAPHTERSFKAPSNKTLLLILSGLLAKRGVRKARREGNLPAS